MLLIDDILLSPFRGILWIFREIHNTAREELDNEPESIAQQLRNLYMQLETNAISEQEFEQHEKVLLDRLDEIEARSEPGGDEEEMDRQEVLEQTPTPGKVR
ncbi:MAG TPA: gas vesicle protein GvpG [Bryobacteraceae bacterium]|nr:gas vesicle protein GvpG [Bryobacteraceae bacterium]